MFFEKITSYFQTQHRLATHRGYGTMSTIPENTLHAFLKATHEHHIYIHESDIRMSKDGVLLLFHGPLLQKTTNGKGKVEKKHINYLKSLNWGAYTTYNKKITTLNQYLQNMPAYCFHNFEIKKPVFKWHTRLESKLLNLIDQYQVEDKTLISSFNWLTLYYIRKQNKSIALGMNIKKYFFYFKVWLASLMSLQSIHMEYKDLTNKRIHYLQKKKFYILTWGENQYENLKQIFNKGVFLAIVDNMQLSKQFKQI